jgi:chemotaxis protein CheZ
MTDHVKNHAYEREQVVKIINSVVSKVESAETLSKECIFKELKSLQDIINKAREDMGLSGASDINQKYIPTATDELDAIIESTASATGTIMDACEHIEEKVTGLQGSAAEEISAEVTKIFEACSFQDITGQRISKVVNTLKQIEIKVEALIETLSSALPQTDTRKSSQGDDVVDINDERTLLNGPQSADKAISQEDIDALLDDLF